MKDTAQPLQPVRIMRCQIPQAITVASSPSPSQKHTHQDRQDVVFAVAVRKIGGSIRGDSRDAIRRYIDNNRWPLDGLGDPCTLARIPGPELIEQVLHV